MKRLIRIIVFVLVVAPSTWAAIAEVAGQNRSSRYATADSGTLAFVSNVGSGSLIIVAGAAYDSPFPTDVTVTDSLSTSYTTITGLVDLTDDGIRVWIAYGITSSAGANTVTVNPQGDAANSFASFSIDEFTGVAAAPLDVNGGNSTGTSTTPADSITTATANALVIGVFSHGGAAPTIAVGSGWTQIGEEEDGVTYVPHGAEFQIVTTATSYTADWTVGASVQWTAVTASFKDAASSSIMPYRYYLSQVQEDGP